LAKVHKGICGNHSARTSLEKKLLHAGYYLPTLQKDAMVYIKKCDAWQRHRNLHKTLLKELFIITIPWIFHEWGMDLLGPFPKLWDDLNC